MTDAVDAEFLLKMWRDETWGRDTLETNSAGYVYSPWIRMDAKSGDPFHDHNNLWRPDRMTDQLRHLFAGLLGLDPRQQVMTHSKTDSDDIFAQYIRFSSAVAWIDSQGMPPGVSGIRGGSGPIGPKGSTGVDYANLY